MLSMAPGYDYVDGRRTDTQSHIMYEAVSPENAFEKILVKVPGTKPLLAQEQHSGTGGSVPDATWSQ
ncbi:MAG: hypothetical protein NC541_09015 [bacterium]|nr:hypothetical protein [bacterium]